jgi:GT2 family glycosyltransferase
MLFYPDGTPQRNASYFPVGFHGMLLALSGRKIPVSPHAKQGTFWLRGVCLLLRVDALRAVGYLDEGFDPGYGEDIDLCYRLAKHGWSLRICQEAQVIHFESQSFGKRTVKWYRQSFRGLFRFLSRSCSPHEWRLLKACWIAGLCLRWAASFTARMIRLKTHLGPPSVYRMVLSDLLQGY